MVARLAALSPLYTQRAEELDNIRLLHRTQLPQPLPGHRHSPSPQLRSLDIFSHHALRVKSGCRREADRPGMGPAEHGRPLSSPPTGWAWNMSNPGPCPSQTLCLLSPPLSLLPAGPYLPLHLRLCCPTRTSLSLALLSTSCLAPTSILSLRPSPHRRGPLSCPGSGSPLTVCGSSPGDQAGGCVLPLVA